MADRRPAEQEGDDPRREFAIIERIRRQWAGAPGTEVGPGDDAAVLRPGPGRLLATADALVEGVHFRRSWVDPRRLGAKALEVNLSDIAAMGGVPRWALVTLGLDEGSATDDFIDALTAGMKQAADPWGVTIAGGDVVSSPVLFISVTLLGEAERPLLRSGARPGDFLCVTGPLGRAAAGLAWLERLGPAGGVPAGDALEDPEDRNAVSRCVGALLEPRARVAAGRALAAVSGVHACIDVSDGLAGDLGHVARESGVGVVVWADRVPAGEEMARLARLLGGDVEEDVARWALSGGEDYELAFAVAPEAHAEVRRALEDLGARVDVVGAVTEPGLGLRIVRPDGSWSPLRGGYDHLAEGRG